MITKMTIFFGLLLIISVLTYATMWTTVTTTTEQVESAANETGVYADVNPVMTSIRGWFHIVMIIFIFGSVAGFLISLILDPEEPMDPYGGLWRG